MELSFGTLPDRVNPGTTHETVVSINDDDDPVVTVNFEHSTYSVAESDDASTVSEQENEVTVTVTLDAVPEREVEITIQRMNQGASDSDYSGVPTSVTFGPTETEQSFTFTAEHDSEDDDDEVGGAELRQPIARPGEPRDDPRGGRLHQRRRRPGGGR